MGFIDVICLANSVKNREHCIAGKVIATGKWVRPVSSRSGEELTTAECNYKDGNSPQLLDLVRLPIAKASAHGHQVENVLIDANSRWEKIGTAQSKNLKSFCDNPATLWSNGHSTFHGSNNYVLPAEVKDIMSSLLLIHVPDIEVRVQYNRYENDNVIHGVFSWKKNHYILSITDPLIKLTYLAKGAGSYYLDGAYLCISLAHAFHDRCSKLIAGVILE